MKASKLIIGTFALLFSLGSAQAADVVLRIGTAVPEATAQGRALEWIAKTLRENGSGIDIKLFHGGQLGTPEAQVQNVRIGAQDGFVESTAWWEPFSDGLGLESAPFVFDGADHLKRWAESDYFDGVQQDLIKNGNQRLIFSDELWWRGPFRVLMASRPILTLDDISKMKLRLPAIEAMTRYWGRDGLGANVVNIAWNDVYLALRQGAADAVTSPFDLVVSMRFVEVAPHIMLIDEFRQIIVVGLNEEKWQAMTPEQQQAFQDAMTEAGKAYNEEINGNVDQWMSELKADGAVVHEFDRAPLVEKVSELNKTFADEGAINADLLAVIDSVR